MNNPHAWSEFWHAQAIWSQKTFGRDQVRGPLGPLKHLAKEAVEAQSKPTDLMEYVDCQFLIFDACRRAGFTPQQLIEGCFAKLAINQARDWPLPSANNTDEAVEHVREEKIDG